MYVNARAIIVRETPHGPEVLLQVRDKEGWGRFLELPGGRLEEYEGLLEGLVREVREETGLEVTHVMGADTRMVCVTDGNAVECLTPFAVYQTLQGPVDSMGVCFVCRAEGEPRAQGGETDQPRWVGLGELAELSHDEATGFSWVDRPAIRLFLQGIGRSLPPAVLR